MANSKRDLFQKRRQRVRNKLRKMAGDRPRLSVHRSLKNISVQVIDDVQGKTLAAASTLEPALGLKGTNNKEAAAKVGAEIAARARPPASRRSTSTGAASCFMARSRPLRTPPVRAV